MEKRTLGWLINGCLLGGAIATSIMFPNPEVIFPVVAVASLTGTIQSFFTVAETRTEKEEELRKKSHKYFISIDENAPDAKKVYENLHTNENHATFKGDHALQKDDNNNPISNTNFERFNNETTQQPAFYTSFSSYDITNADSAQMNTTDSTSSDDDTMSR